MDTKNFTKQFSGLLRLLKSTRVYTIVGTYLANRQVLRFAKETPESVSITLIVCFTLLGLTYILSETIRKMYEGQD